MRMQESHKAEAKDNRRVNLLLWIIQVLLAAMFLFAGGMKLLLPVAELTRETPLPGAFLRFIGVLEICGALGLLLPGALRIRTGLTPLAAAGLCLLMIGATFITLSGSQARMAWIPLATGILAAIVAYGRWRMMSAKSSVSPSISYD